jgi:hypothetical protein
MPLMSINKRKWILFLTLSLNCIATFCLCIKNKYVTAFLRVFIGISQVIKRINELKRIKKFYKN